MNALLKLMVQRGASALHLTVGAAPVLRVDGKLALTSQARLSPEQCESLVYSILNGEQKAHFERYGEIDTSFGVKGLARLRMTAFRQRGSVAATVRLVPTQHPSLAELGLPSSVEALVGRVDRGLVLIAGYSGAGKSSTLAGIVDWTNRNRVIHLLTLDRAAEHVHFHERSIVNQIETGFDAGEFVAALARVQRQDPDVIAIGDLDDPDTVPYALALAESGRLVAATLNSPDAVSALARLIDAFPPHRQARARSQLSLALQGLIVQTLVPHASFQGRVVACEVLIPSPSVRVSIREGHLDEVSEAIRKAGVSMNQNLAALIAAGHVERNVGLASSPIPEELERLLDHSGASTRPAAAPKGRSGFNPMRGLDANEDLLPTGGGSKKT
jgi:twitching motility protein PilT